MFNLVNKHLELTECKHQYVFYYMLLLKLKKLMIKIFIKFLQAHLTI